MKEYRKRRADTARTHTGVTGNLAPSAVPYRPPAFTTLAQQYGLDDMSFEAPNIEEASVVEEFYSYVNAPLSPPLTNTVKYWEVRTLIRHIRTINI
jgi:hypothetical protein